MKYQELMNEEEIAIVEGLIPEAKRMLDAAKIALLRYRPFYGVMIGSMPIYVDYKWLPTIATNGRDLFYNPEFIVGMTDRRKELVFQRIDSTGKPHKVRQKLKDEIQIFYARKSTRAVVFLLEHEIRHIICDHLARGKGYDPKLFNIAADHYINTDLVMEHSTKGQMNSAWFMGKNTTFPAGTEFAFMAYGCCNFKYDGWVTEKIYEDLVKNGVDGKISADHHMNGGGGAPGQADSDDGLDWDGALGLDARKEPVMSKEKSDSNREAMRRAITAAVQTAGGESPKDARELVASFEKAKLNYVKLIKKKMLAKIRTNVSYRRPSRRSFGLTRSLRDNGIITSRQTVVLPSVVYGNTVDIWIGFDVSGSVTDDLLKRIFREIMGLTLQYKQFRIHLFCWSTKVGNLCVYNQDNIREIKNYKITTTGGTTASCVFNFLDEQPEKCDQLIVFTDGYFEDLSKRTDWAKKYDTLWVIFGNSNFKEPFGKQVDFDKYLK